MLRYYTRIIDTIRDIYDRYKARKNLIWLEERKRLVKAACIAEGSALSGQSFIENGTYHWKYAEGPIKIDLFFPYVPIAIVVSDRNRGPYDAVKEFAPSYRFWQARNLEESLIVRVCKSANVPVLVVGPNDPVDLYSVAEGVDEALDNR